MNVHKVTNAVESHVARMLYRIGLTASESGAAGAAMGIACWGIRPIRPQTPTCQRALAKAYYLNPRVTREALELVTTAHAMARASR